MRLLSIPPRALLTGLLVIDAALLALALYLGHTGHHNPGHFLGEGEFITHLSAVQLSAVAVFCFFIFRYRLPVSGRAALLWLAIAAGFVFLTVDDLAQVHENLDKWIHKGLHIKPNNITTRLDDLIILFYGIIGAGVMWVNRAELKAYRNLQSWLVAGFICLLLSVGLDLFTHRSDAIRMLVADPGAALAWLYWLQPLEEVFKILAEGLFAGTFYAALRQTFTQRTAVPQSSVAEEQLAA